MSPSVPPFVPDPVEVALCGYLRLPLDEVVAGSFSWSEHGVVTWQQLVDGRVVHRTVKLEPMVLRAVIERAHDKERRGDTLDGSSIDT